MATDRGIKEWSAVVDAMGRGDQSLLIRIYEPPAKELLLYPTFNFYGSNRNRPEKFDNLFQSEFRENARKAGEFTRERAHKDGIVDIEFFARIDQTIPVQRDRVWKRLAPHFIWSWEHVAEYGNGSKSDVVWIWLCRVYRLNKPLKIGRVSALPPNSYRHFEQVSTDEASPVLSDNEFEKVRAEVLQITETSRVSAL